MQQTAASFGCLLVQETNDHKSIVGASFGCSKHIEVLLKVRLPISRFLFARAQQQQQERILLFDRFDEQNRSEKAYKMESRVKSECRPIPTAVEASKPWVSPHTRPVQESMCSHDVDQNGHWLVVILSILLRMVSINENRVTSSLKV